MRAIGMMSGTSMDGIDIALIETDGEANVTRRAATSRQYTPSQRDGLAAAMVEASRMLDRNERPGSLGRIERQLTELHAQLVHDFLAENGVDAGSVDVIGFHGQTVLHRAEERLTVQLGDGALLARLTRVPVVYDMRAADIAAGGQGAPLAPAYHRAFAAKLSERPVAILNIGGVANVTWIGEGEDILAFDTGPGNALMDDWVSRQSNEPYDRDGALARTGNVDIDRLSVYLKHPVSAAAGAEVARPVRLHVAAAGRAGDGGRRGDAGAGDRRGGGAQRLADAGAAEGVGDLRWWTPQRLPDGTAAASPRRAGDVG